MRDFVTLLLIEAIAFALAAAVHLDIVPAGFEDEAAGTAEGIIGLVLLAGWTVSRLRPDWSRLVAIGTQAFALLGSIVGLTLTVMLGPSRIPDIAFHVGIVLVLLWGLATAWPARPDASAGA
jgi:hypothetical protein